MHPRRFIQSQIKNSKSVRNYFIFLINIEPQHKFGFLIVTATDYTVLGDEKVLACSYAGLPKSVKVGGQILIADGTLVCIVKEVKEVNTTTTTTKNPKKIANYGRNS